MTLAPLLNILTLFSPLPLNQDFLALNMNAKCLHANLSIEDPERLLPKDLSEGETIISN